MASGETAVLDRRCRSCRPACEPKPFLRLLVDGVKEKLDRRPYRGVGEGNPKRLVEGASRAFSNRSSFLTLRGDHSGAGADGPWSKPDSDQFSLDGIHHRFQAIVSPQLLVDVVEVVTERLGTNAESESDVVTVLALGEQTKDVLFVFGQWGYRRCTHRSFADRSELLR